MFGIFKKLMGGNSSQEIKEALHNNAQLIDVRSPMEFASGSVKGAVNIPLDRIALDFNKIRKEKPVVVFCRSGNRSSQAKSILESKGYTVLNGGSVQAVKALQ